MVNWNIPKMLQNIRCPIYPKKIHENSFTRFSVMLLTDRQTDEPTDNDENITTASAEVIIPGLSDRPGFLRSTLSPSV